MGNRAHFRPVVPLRGIPLDASDEVADDPTRYWGSPYDLWATWISLSEIRSIDWDEYALYPDSSIHHITKDERGNIKYYNKSFDPNFPKKPIAHIEEEGLGLVPIWAEQEELQPDGSIIKIVKLQRHQILSSDWKVLFQLMDVLGTAYGEENVRLIVWFDR